MAKVLVVDDAPELRQLLEVRLRQAGHRVVTAGSGEEALQVLADKGAPDVAVLDVLMPGMSGLELCALLRQDPAYAHVPVIFLSGRVLPEDIEAGKQLGASYMTKPVVMTALNNAIDKALAASLPAPVESW
jgi:CheY-like chemotaxis protein